MQEKKIIILISNDGKGNDEVKIVKNKEEMSILEIIAYLEIAKNTLINNNLR